MENLRVLRGHETQILREFDTSLNSAILVIPVETMLRF